MPGTVFQKAYLLRKNTRFLPESQKFSKDIFLASGSLLVYSDTSAGIGFQYKSRSAKRARSMAARDDE
jgi:hypothetical protein